jgi:hypothetical protein
MIEKEKLQKESEDQMAWMLKPSLVSYSGVGKVLASDNGTKVR